MQINVSERGAERLRAGRRAPGIRLPKDQRPKHGDSLEATAVHKPSGLEMAVIVKPGGKTCYLEKA